MSAVKRAVIKQTAYTQFKAQNANPLYPIADRIAAPRPGETPEFAQRNAEVSVFAEEYAQIRRNYFNMFALGRDRRVDAAKARAPLKDAERLKWNHYIERLKRTLNPQAYWTPEQMLKWKLEVTRTRLTKRLGGRFRLKHSLVGLRKDRQRRLALMLRMIDNSRALLHASANAQKMSQAIEPKANASQKLRSPLLFITKPEQLDSAIDQAISRVSFFDYSEEEMVGIWRGWQKRLSEQPSHGPPLKFSTEVDLPEDLFTKGMNSALWEKYRRKSPVKSIIMDASEEGAQ